MILDLQLADNVKARVIDAAQANRYVPRAGRPVRAQHEIYRFLETRSAANLSEAAATPGPEDRLAPLPRFAARTS
jgi:hypothetical protein